MVEKDAVFQRLLEEGVLTCGLLPPLVTFHQSFVHLVAILCILY